MKGLVLLAGRSDHPVELEAGTVLEILDDRRFVGVTLPNDVLLSFLHGQRAEVTNDFNCRRNSGHVEYR